MIEPSTLGERLAFHRKRRGLSQVSLGRLIGRSESWVSQVERGVRTVDRMSVLAQVAEALDITVRELAPDLAQDEPAEYSPYVLELRRALTGHPALASVLHGARDRRPASGDIERLGARVDAVWPLVHGALYREAGPLLFALIPELETTVRALPQGNDHAEVSRLASTAYQAAAALLAKLGDTEAGWIASDRALMAAERAGDPLLVVAGQYRLAQVLMVPTHLGHARFAATAALDALEGLAPGRQPEAAVSLLGALHLALAVIAAREGDRGTAGRHLEKARDAAALVGDGRNDFGTEFGPVNVRLHEVGIAVELGDAGEALDRAAQVDASSLSAERRARFLIDCARAYSQRRRFTEAVERLLEAEELTPDQVRDHPRVRELVTDLLHSDGRGGSSELRALALRVGIIA